MKNLILAAVIVIAFLATLAQANANVEEGSRLFEAGDYEPAKEIFEDILARDPNNKTALYYLGRINHAYSDLDRAQDYLEKLVEMEPDNSDYRLRLGNVYGEKARTSGFFMSKKKWAGKWKEQLELAFELDPNNLDAREWLALYLLNAPGIGGGDKSRGTDIARETIAIDEPFGRLLLAYAYRRVGEIDQAIGEYEAVLELEPKDSRAYSGLGYAYLKKEEFEISETNFKKAVEVAPDDVQASEALAYYYLAREQTDQRIETEERSLELDPLLSDTRYELGRIYEKRKDKTRAMYHYEQLIALTPQHHKAGSARSRLKKLKNPRRGR